MDKLLCIIFTAYLGISRVQGSSDNSSLYRLPTNVWPESYDVFLLTNVTRGDFSYKGQVSIDLWVTQSTNKVVVHSEKLRIITEKSEFIKAKSNGKFESVRIGSQQYEEETQFHTLRFGENLLSGRYILVLHFVGEVLDDVFGFYRSSYKVNGESRWIGVTQFSPTYARRAFPCMDEPGFKAKFQLRIGHYKNETVSSNTFEEVRISTDEPGYFITKFSKTPRMSTYLLGWAIHSFNRVDLPDSRFWLWTRHNDPQFLQASPLLTEGPKIYSALEEWTNISNPVAKFEQFAVPDFNFMAMENWGFVTYRESVPIIWPESTSLLTIHDRLITLSHEYAHTWFGNLVTPTFWSVAWLKEGFATYFAYLAMSIVHNEWRPMDLFPLEVLQTSLLLDSEEHNRTMNGRNVGSAKSVTDAMDFVTYKKGASIIRMVSDVVGESTFKKAMRSYLKAKKYEAATPSDLYKHLELALNSSNCLVSIPVSIGEIIDSWANQTNYPLIRATRVSVDKLLVSQEPFCLNRSSLSKTESRFWWIPLKLATHSRYSGRLINISAWLGSEKNNIIKMPSAQTSETDWFLLNPQQIGYYRIQYDTENWRALIEFLNSDDFHDIPASARAALIDDAFNLARAGYENYDLVLKLVGYLKREDEYEPWDAASRSIRLIDNKLKDKPNAQSVFRRYILGLITPIYKQLSFEERPLDSRIKRMQRALILSTTCSLNFGDCVLSAKSIFNNWIADENKPVPANLKGFVYRVAVFNGTDNDWINLWQRFLKTDFHSEKEPMINALAYTENELFINKYLDFSIQPKSDVVKQYRLLIIQHIVVASSKNIITVLDYVEANLSKIIELRGVPFLEDVLSAIGKAVTSVAQENKLEMFIKKNANLLGKAMETGKKAIKSAGDNIAWIDTCASQITKYLSYIV